ncbi:excinuclease ABC subunit UvrA [Crossiella sp. NPDC003009]
MTSVDVLDSTDTLLPDRLIVRGARVHNLRGVNLDLPHRKLIVFTGVSGSGKSSLAFDTLYAEAQRRQVQSLSTFARQFMNEMDKPAVDLLAGLCSAVAVDQRSSATRSPRSTVGTVTEVFDLMRVVWATAGVPHCTVCAEELLPDNGILVCLDGHDTEVPEMYNRSFSFNLPFGQCPDCLGLGAAADPESTEQRLCAGCGGARLRPAQLGVRLDGRSIAEVNALPVTECLRFFSTLELPERQRRVLAQALAEITDRLRHLTEVGLGYLSLDRPARTLSGGEAQRIRLATQLGTQLFGLLYVLDEPTAGLHPQDVHELIGTLKSLRDRGNTLIVVEHDEHLIRAADWVVELGPAAGEHGGQLVFTGTAPELLADPESLTGAYLSGRRTGHVPARRRTPAPGRELVVRGARENNLAGIDVAFPLGCFVVVSGVSGAGKSTLVDTILYRAVARALGAEAPPPGAHERVDGLSHLDRVIRVDQAPIGRSGRSTPATYTGILDAIRKLFAQTPTAKELGFTPGRFSFNSPGGRCETCAGDGTVRVEMYFLPDVFLECDTCHGTRYDADTLKVTYRGRTIAEVLDLPIEAAAEFFTAAPAIAGPLRTLCEVGLGYLRLGQAANTLSGGEAQRVKLAAELQRRPGKHTLYVLDEPTTGLHASDVARLMGVLHRLVAKGHTVITVSHNAEVVRGADWVIDLGPAGGDGGGQVVATGNPEQIAANPASRTGRYLAR